MRVLIEKHTKLRAENIHPIREGRYVYLTRTGEQVIDTVRDADNAITITFAQLGKTRTEQFDANEVIETMIWADRGW